jgi:epoxyqueuosine reductase
MNILLHICCAPCEIYPVEKLRKDRHLVGGFFYNPNIHPYAEYLKRRTEVEKYSGGIGMDLAVGDYDIEDFFQDIIRDKALNNRCPVCWRLRIKKTAQAAKERGFDAFTSTLLGSPYQEHGVVKKICEDAAEDGGIKFYYEDFRAGFKEAHDMAKKSGIYCQNYCGCLFSERERAERKR